MKKYWMGKIPFFILLAAAGIMLFSWIVMLLWNATLPALVGVKLISFWQAAGLLVLSKILFGGFRGGPGWGAKHQMRKHWREKMANMSEEERAKFRDKCKWYFRGKQEEGREA